MAPESPPKSPAVLALEALENMNASRRDLQVIIQNTGAIQKHVQTLIDAGIYEFQPIAEMVVTLATQLDDISQYLDSSSAATPSAPNLSARVSEIQSQYLNLLIETVKTTLLVRHSFLVAFQADIEEKIKAQKAIISHESATDLERQKKLKQLFVFLGNLPQLYTLQLRVRQRADPWQLLDIDRDADEQAINKAFRKLAKVCHPDFILDAWREMSQELFKAINQANDKLINPTLQRKYQAPYRPPAEKIEKDRRPVATSSDLLREASLCADPELAIDILKRKLKTHQVINELGFEANLGNSLTVRLFSSQTVDHPLIRQCLSDLEAAIPGYQDFERAVTQAQTLEDIQILLEKFSSDQYFPLYRDRNLVTVASIRETLTAIQAQLASLSLREDTISPNIAIYLHQAPEFLRTVISRIIMEALDRYRSNCVSYGLLTADPNWHNVGKLIKNTEYDLELLRRVSKMITKEVFIPLSRVDQVLGLSNLNPSLRQALVEALQADGYVIDFTRIQTVEELVALLRDIQQKRYFRMSVGFIDRLASKLHTIIDNAKNEEDLIPSSNFFHRKKKIKVEDLTHEKFQSDVLPYLLVGDLPYQPLENMHFQEVILRLLQNAAGRQ